MGSLYPPRSDAPPARSPLPPTGSPAGSRPVGSGLAGADSDRQTEASTLCVACGLCCRGLLHRYALTEPGEEALLEELGLSTRTSEKRLVFDLPCHHLGAEGCRVYTRRPATCRSYQCRLLKDFLSGRIDFPTAKGRIDRARGLADSLSDHLDSGHEPSAPGASEVVPLRSLWQQLAEQSPPKHTPQRLMDLAELRVICGRYFKNRTTVPRQEAAP